MNPAPCLPRRVVLGRKINSDQRCDYHRPMMPTSGARCSQEDSSMIRDEVEDVETCTTDSVAGVILNFFYGNAQAGTKTVLLSVAAVVMFDNCPRP